MKELHELKDMLCDELMKYGQKGELTTGSLDVVDKLAHTIKNLDKIIEKYGDDYSGMYPYSWDDDGSYRGRSYAQRRDSMGRYSSRYSNRYSNRYSRHGDMISELHDLMQDAPDEHTKMEFQKFISKMEQTM